MIDLTRFRGPALAVAGVLIAAACVDFALTATVGETARWLPNHEFPSDRWVIAKICQRLSGLAEEARSQSPAPGEGEKLGLLLGQSTLLCGVDPVALGDADGLPLHWLNLAGIGGSINRISEIADLVFFEGIKPDVVVLAINPYMLVGTDYAIVRRLESERSRNRIKPWVWTWENRTVANLGAQIDLHVARLRLARAFGLGLRSFFKPIPSMEPTDNPPDRHKTDEEIKSRLGYDLGLGWCDPARYNDPNNDNPESLATLIRRFREVGSEVVIVLMPERSLLRAEQVPAGRDRIVAIARDAMPGRPVPVIDLTDKLPDEVFMDLDHVDLVGRAACTKLFADRLHALLAARYGAR